MAEGDIGAVIDSLVFTAGNCAAPEMINVAGNVFAVAFSGVDNDGFVATIEIATDGNIGAAVIDIFEFEGGSCYTPQIIRVSDNVFAIPYRGPVNDGYIVTVGIANNGTITTPVLDSFVFEGANIALCDIVHVIGVYYAIAYEGGLTKGYVRTITISDLGAIGPAVIDTLCFDATTGTAPKIIQIYETVYAVVYVGADGDGFIATFDIDSNGEIGAAVIDRLEFDDNYCLMPSMAHVSGNIFGIAYTSVGFHGSVATVEIAQNGAIGAAVIDTFEFFPDYCSSPNIRHVSGSYFLIGWVCVGNDGCVVTVNISSAGDITDPVHDSLEFDEADCSEPCLVHVSGDVYAVVYTFTGTVGKITTFDVVTLAGGSIRHELLMGI